MARKKYSPEETLRALYNLQYIDSRIDRMREVRGELPMEVKDLEDEMEGLNKSSKTGNIDVITNADRII